jgi:hypothetical protein
VHVHVHVHVHVLWELALGTCFANLLWKLALRELTRFEGTNSL